MSQEGKDLAAYNSNNSNNQGTCIVCYKNVNTYSIGMCEHPVCYECSTRMRVLCQQNECPICRQDLPIVVFTKNIKPFRHLNKGELFDSRYNIYFDDLEIQEKFTQLLAHVCPVCKDKQLFSTFNALKDHMRKRHELQYCDLCVENLKIFSRERRCYSRADLAMHRRRGDKDDKSHKGHPLCEFCECRYMDNDQLFRHLRRDHLYCHFCDADGLHQYYNDYDCLRDHFRSEHYLCEEGTCAEEKFTSVFRTDIDLKAHKANVHNKHLGKAAAKQARTLELEFTLAPRSGVGGDGHRNASKRPGQYNSARKTDNTNDDSGSSSRDFNQRDQNPLLFNSSTPRQIDVGSTEEFPTLGNAPTSLPNFNQIKRSQGQGNITIRGSLKSPALAVTDENFPALSGSDASNSSNEISKTVNFSIYNTSKSGPSGSQSAQCSGSGAPNVSIHVNHKISDGTITTKVSGPNIRIKPSQLKMNYSDFPALSSSSQPSNTNTVKIGQWTKVTCSKPQTTIATKKVTSRPASINLAPSLSSATPPAISSGDAFPSLPNPSSRSKKTSSVSSTFQSTSSQSNRHQTVDDDSTDQNTASSDAGKSNKKKKKKKVKDQSHESDDSKSTNSKSHGNESKVQNDNQPSRIVSKLDSNNKNKTNKSAIINNNNHTNNNNNNNNNHNGSVNSDAKKSEMFNFNKESTRSKQNSENTDTTNTSNALEMANTAKKIQAKPNELPRKRSELKIDNLNKLDHLRNNSQDSVTQKQSSNSYPTNPPPGFGTTAPPPPGFAIKLDSLNVNSQNDGGLTFTNSLGESYSILPDEWVDKSFSYVPPPDFQKRNKNLVTKISQVLDEQESIGDFRCISGLFKQGDCSAEDYYKHCRDSMGMSAFGQIFPEMLVLLPDLPKQRKLYELFKKEFPNNTTLKVCPTCNQIVKSGDDLKAHYTSHTLDSHFPALAGGQTTSTQSLHTWVRKNT